MKIANRVQTSPSIGVKIHCELEIQLQEFIKSFKLHVLGDTRVIELGTKVHEESSRPQAPSQG